MNRFPLRRKPQAPGSKFPKRRSPIYREYVKARNCVVATHARTPSPCYAKPARYKIECAHWPTQGSGAYDVGQSFPACPGHHDEQEGKTAEFERRYGLCLADICLEIKTEWEAASLTPDGSAHD